MNSAFFLLHIFLMAFFVAGAFRIGKGALIALIALQSVLANLFVVKQISLFGLSVTCSDVFIVGSILGLNLLQENFGKEEAKKAVRICFFCLLFFVCMSQLHLAYAPSEADRTHEAFSFILSSTPRIVTASFVVYYLVQKWDIYFFQWLQKRWDSKRLTLRLWISLLLSQALDTVLFSFLGLYGIVDSIVDIMILSYAVKCGIIFLSAPLTLFCKRWTQRQAA